MRQVRNAEGISSSQKCSAHWCSSVKTCMTNCPLRLRKVWKLPVTMLAPGLVWSGLLHHVPPRNPTLPSLPGLWVNFNFHSAPRPGISPTVVSVLAFEALLDRSSRVLAYGGTLGAWFTGISALPTTPDMKLCTARVLGHLLLFHRPQYCFNFMESISYYKITCR